MIYSSEHFSISIVQEKDALRLNKLLVSNTDRFIKYLPKTLAANSTLESTQIYIKKKKALAEKKEEFVFVMNDNQGNNIIGLIILKQLDWQKKRGEFAYCIGKRFKGKGLMTAAIKAISTHAVDVMGLKTLQIISNATNLASVNVALKAGYKWKETLEGEFTSSDGTAMDMELFELRYER